MVDCRRDADKTLFPALPHSSFPALPPGDVLITGASGFLGGALVRHLLAAGVEPARLRCLVRDRTRAAAGGLPAASLRDGDLGDPDSQAALLAAASEVGSVLHLAGTLKASRAGGYDAVNVAGTARLVAAVARAAPRAHFVLVSSLAAAGPSCDGAGTDAPPDRCRPVSHYGDSKRRGELEVVRGLGAWTILRPPVVYGPGDGATRLLFRQALAAITAVPPRARPLSVIHGDDVVRALVAALERRPAGAVLPLDGPERTDTHALMRAIAGACGRRARLLPVPLALAWFAAGACDLVAAARRRASYFNRDKVRELQAAGWVADGRAARRELGFLPAVGLADGLAAVARAEGFARLTSATA